MSIFNLCDTTDFLVSADGRLGNSKRGEEGYTVRLCAEDREDVYFYTWYKINTVYVECKYSIPKMHNGYIFSGFLLFVFLTVDKLWGVRPSGQKIPAPCQTPWLESWYGLDILGGKMKNKNILFY